MSFRSSPAFTLVELLIALSVSSILVGATASLYSLFRRSMTADQAKADISQNGRVALDRLSRELRQTPLLVTDLPADENDSSVPQASAIEFENGHTGDLSYYSYYLSGTTLDEDVLYYYFAADPATRVLDTATDSFGNPPLSSVVSTTAIAENVQSLNFYGSGSTIRIDITTAAVSQSYTAETLIERRN